MLNSNLSSPRDADVDEYLVKPIPSSFKDPDVLTIFLAMREDNNRCQIANRSDMQEMRGLYKEMHELHNKMAENLVGWNRCTSLRERCVLENGEKFKDIFHQLEDLNNVAQDYKSCKENVATPLALSCAEESAVKRAKEEDAKIITEFKTEFFTLRESVDQIKNVFVLFKFSRCSAKLLWTNKRVVSSLFVFITVWFYLMDTIARWSQWTFFPPKIGP